MEAYDDIDDENDWKAMDSDDEALSENAEEDPERDDDVDIGFRSHNFQYGSFAKRNKRSRKQNQEEAIYGVFYEHENDQREITATAPMFVPAQRPKETTSTRAPMFVAASKQNGKSEDAPIFVSATNEKQKIDTTTLGGTKESKQEAPEDESAAREDREEAERIQREKKAADDHFLALLEKAKSKKSLPRKRPRSPSTSIIPSNHGLGVTTLPNSFGMQGGGLGFVHEEPPARKDPTVGTWEKHTKGFGSKLLAKMGWKGSGGLGSNRRTFRGESKPETKSDSAPATTTPEQNAGQETMKSLAVKKGISRPVEVVVRPSNMGLGFGNFKEASQLKANRRIEAEVRGIDYDAQLAKEKEEQRKKRRLQQQQRFGRGVDMTDSDGQSDDEDDVTKSMNSSAIASTDDLLSNQSWKAKRFRSKSKRKKQDAPEIIPYQELIERQNRNSNGQPVIIDMRGPDYATKAKTTPTGQPVALGEELLYNLSFLLNTYENKLHSSARYHGSTLLPKVKLAETEIKSLQDRSSKVQARLSKLRTAYTITKRVRDETESMTIAIKRNPDTTYSIIVASRNTVKELVTQLEDLFTPEERNELQFWNVLAPTLLGPVVQETLRHWKPFSRVKNTDSKKIDKHIIDSFFEWKDRSSRDGRILCESIIRGQLIPKLKSDIESECSPRWDPIQNPFAVLDIYEYLRGKSIALDGMNSADEIGKKKQAADENDDPNQVFESSHDSDSEMDKAQSSNLAEYVRKELILDTLYPKLQKAILLWKPKLTENDQVLEYPLHQWILPWLVHIDHPSILPSLLQESKRKLKSALAVLRRAIVDDLEYIQAVLELLKPWRAILGDKSILKITSQENHLPTRLVRIFSASSTSNWEDTALLFELHSHSMLSDVDFMSIIEGPMLTHWAGRIHKSLSHDFAVTASDNDASILERAIDEYKDWKLHIFIDPLLSMTNKSVVSVQKSIQLLRADERTCRIFYSILRMIQIYKEQREKVSTERQNELQKLEPQIVGFHTIVSRRTLEEKEATREDLLRMESRSEGEARAKVRLRRKHQTMVEPTFREVVEEFANEQGVLFQPRQKGSAMKDGKPIYSFGDQSIYLEGDVVFCYKDSIWKPMSLDQLGKLATGNLSK